MTVPRIAGMGIALLSGLALAGCSVFPDWFGGSEAPPLPGERISILALEQTIEPDPRIADLAVRLPRPYVNEAWPQNGGYPDRAMHHLSAGEVMSVVWKVDIGSGAGNDGRILSTPIMAGNRVFVVDAVGEISAFEASTGDHLWSVEAVPEEDDDGGFAGGVAYADDKLFATTGFGEVLALDPSNGEFLWRQRIGIPSTLR